MPRYALNWIGANDVLHYLQIENFAIVKQLKLHFKEGLTIISGETGAGKSILIDALSLLLGERADTSVVRQGCDSAVVNAIFTLPPVAQAWLEAHAIDNEEECFVRRVINCNGRSRGYINDQPVSVQTLRTLGEYLIDIHGQHAHQSLLKKEAQRQLVDEMAENKTVLAQLRACYQQWHSVKHDLEALGGEDREATLAFLHYQVEELEDFELTTEALEALDNEHSRLANAQQLLEHSQEALLLLDNDDRDSILSSLNQANHILDEVEKHDAKIGEITDFLDSAIIQTQEAVGELRHYLLRMDLDSERLQEIQQQVSLLQDIARKHRIRVSELPVHFKNLTAQLLALEEYEEQATALREQLVSALKAYQVAAHALHQERIKTAQLLSQKISIEMHSVGLGGGELMIHVEADNTLSPTITGIDKVEFLVSTNPGHPPKSLNKVASGGELSRISLAIQVITARNSGVPILVFDEVDVGIGGSVAEIVGKSLHSLGQQRQVLCITHLPQVASQGDHHLQVSKRFMEGTTVTQIKALIPEERVTEIARMLGGVDITSHTLAHAQEMLQTGAKPY
ncbi:MAG: DNA repair protein RecN [Thiomargarita sp.]|nr:DNA repair protein RecN [Thiomargarita sp.]